MRKMLIVFIMVFLFMSVFPVLPLPAQENGEINWVEGYVRAIGNGVSTKSIMAQARPMARRAAMADAYRTLLETIKGVKVDSSTTVENFMVTQDIIKTEINGVVKGAKVVKETYEPQQDGSLLATVEMRVCLNDCTGRRSIIQSLNIDQYIEPPYVPRNKIKDVPAANTPPPAKEHKVIYDTSKPVTGIVINLEGRSFERVLLPVVIVEGLGSDPLTVYSVKCVNPAVVRTHGIVRYADNVEQARSNPRLGKNVMLVPAIGISKPNMIAVNPEAARLIRETTAHGNDYLGEAKVVIANQ